MGNFALIILLAAFTFSSFFIKPSSCHNFFAQINHAKKCASQYGTHIVTRSRRDKSAVIISVRSFGDITTESGDTFAISEEIFHRLGKHTVLSVVGLPSDVSLLSRKGFGLNEYHWTNYGTDMKARRLLSALSSFIHAQTLSLHQRPLALGAALIDFEGPTPKVYECDNIGNTYECDCTCIGKHAEDVIEALRPLRLKLKKIITSLGTSCGDHADLSTSDLVKCCLQAVKQVGKNNNLAGLTDVQIVIFDANGNQVDQRAVHGEI